ncbi:2-hydroxyacid dehydrogenase [Pollutimonas sp. H1-120]|uniref:2-hydroxyacid dehydrogenase n=1 Tax=Pollutimonas sp. H1-120 TaxID=3148824 RepID=UPI003B522E77
MIAPSRFPPLLKVGVFPDPVEQALRDVFTLVELDELGLAGRPGHDEIAGIVTRSNYRISRELIDQLPGLRIISTNGVGYDGIPLDYARRKGVIVTNTPEVLNEAVAEMAVGLLLALLRHIPRADAFVKEGAWTTMPFPLGTTLAGKKVGIVGLGRIGKEIVKRLLPFRVEVAYFGRSRQDAEWMYFDDVNRLAAHADILILCCPGGPETYGMIDAGVLRSLGPSGFLVNIARGSVVNESDLYRALADRTVAGAALDVFNHEPLDASPLRRLDNVVLAPHVGSATRETRMQMAALAIDNLCRFFDTGSAVTPVP